MMADSQIEWVEIVEPQTREHMYANLITGECAWDPPPGARIKKTHENQWWELYDQNTGRFYYYNASTQKTVWQRPYNCDIIPLAKLQTLKQNTEARHRTSAARQQHASPVQMELRGNVVLYDEPLFSVPNESINSPCTTASSLSPHSSRSSTQTSTTTRRPETKTVSCQTQTSPITSPKARKRVNKTKGCQTALSASHLVKKHSHRTGGGRSRSRSRRNVAISAEPEDSIQEALIVSLNKEKRSADFRNTKNAAVPVPAVRQSLKLHSEQSQRSNLGNLSRQRSFDFACNFNQLRLHEEEELTVDDGQTEEIQLGEEVSEDKNSMVMKNYGASNNTINAGGGKSAKKVSLKTANVCHSKARVVPATASISGSPQIWQAIDNSSTCTAGTAVWKSHDSGIKSGDSGARGDDSSSAASVESPRFGHLDGSQSAEREVEESSSSSSNDDSAPDDDDDEGLFADDEEGGPPSPVSLSILVSQSCLSSKKYLLPTMGVSQRFFDPDDSRLRVIYDTPDTPSKESKSITPHDCADPLLLDSVLYRRRSSDAGNFSTPKLNATVGSCSNNSMAEEESGSTKRALKNVVEKPARSSMNGFVSTAADLSPNQYRPQSVLMSGHQEHYLAPTNLIPNHSSTLNRLNKAECTRTTTTTSGPMHHHHQQQQQLLRLKESDGVELYPHEYLNRHKKGLFGKRQSVQSMLSWTRKPLIMTVDKAVKKEAREIFKRIQAYMGDRKVKKSTITVDMLALDVCVRGWAKPALRDEIFIQLCKQTTENPRPESVRRGWELMSICLKFFPPSSQFTSYLDTYICRYADPVLDLPEVSVSHYAQHCCKRLERILRHGARRGLRKPTIEEVEQARLQIFHPSMFGNTLDEVMVIQRERFTGRKLPWIQTTLSELVLQLNGAKTEGIFRVPGDIDEVNALKMRIDRWLLPPVADPHIPASLLKLWYRELADPLVPDCLYQECIQTVDEPLKSCEIADRLPSINRLVLAYLIRFLQIFIRPENVAHTKMDSSNLAMVMAPNCLRCQSDDPTVIFDNTRKEMTFLRNLMEHYDTSFVDGLL
ncbi:RhoGAP domain protein [Trichinella nativa]|uniref:Rho GTPase-activating protein 39 n=1 Tax=Trichinella nativa TaxID=6335 RepID=A0A1Y3ESX8_9BILA|nr:RhoGAP domain protein [Trichinella nativa]